MTTYTKSELLSMAEACEAGALRLDELAAQAESVGDTAFIEECREYAAERRAAARDLRHQADKR